MSDEQECLWSEEARRTEDFIDILDKLLQKTQVVKLDLDPSGVSLDEINKILKRLPNP